jgi:hypothetical protein
MAVEQGHYTQCINALIELLVCDITPKVWRLYYVCGDVVATTSNGNGFGNMLKNIISNGKLENHLPLN